MRDASRSRWPAERESSPGGRIGEILVSRGTLSQEQLRAGLEVKKTDPRRIGEILLSLGFVSEEDLAQAVAESCGLEYVALTEDSVDPAAIPLLGEKALRKYAALPLKVENGRLVLAVSDPTNVLALDDLKTLSRHPIRPVVAPEENIKKLQDRVFGIDEEISELVETSGDGSRQREDKGGTLSVSRVDEGGPVIRLVNSIIRRALIEGASDIHVEPRAEELVVRYRVDGVLKRGMSAPMRLKDSVISRFKILGDLDIAMSSTGHKDSRAAIQRPVGRGRAYVRIRRNVRD
jgi:type IV pilus assembly protein PilB